MVRRFLLICIALVGVAACSAEQREALQTMVAAVPEQADDDAPDAAASPIPSQSPTGTPALSTFPTALPTMDGPLGTLTAIAPLVASQVPDTTPYEIVNRGNPHFIEFHAWW